MEWLSLTSIASCAVSELSIAPYKTPALPPKPLLSILFDPSSGSEFAGSSLLPSCATEGWKHRCGEIMRCAWSSVILLLLLLSLSASTAEANKVSAKFAHTLFFTVYCLVLSRCRWCCYQ
jgi:hypothetical protein